MSEGISIEEFEKLKERIEKLEKLVNSQEKEIQFIWTDNSNADYRPSIDDIKIIDKCQPGKFEICILNQHTYCDRGYMWNENDFRSIGVKRFMTEEEALNYLNGDVKNWDKEHYMNVCDGRKLYLHNIERNQYKRLRKTSEDRYYLKK